MQKIFIDRLGNAWDLSRIVAISRVFERDDVRTINDAEFFVALENAEQAWVCSTSEHGHHAEAITDLNSTLIMKWAEYKAQEHVN